MTLAGTTWQEIENRLAELPSDDLPKVLEYVEFLAFKHAKDRQPRGQVAEQQAPYRIAIRLEGLWADHPISEEEIASARREIWSGFGEFEP